MSVRPEGCCFPDCFHCPLPDCMNFCNEKEPKHEQLIKWVAYQQSCLASKEARDDFLREHPEMIENRYLCGLDFYDVWYNPKKFRKKRGLKVGKSHQKND